MLKSPETIQTNECAMDEIVTPLGAVLAERNEQQSEASMSTYTTLTKNGEDTAKDTDD